MITPGSVNPLLMTGGREITPCGGSVSVPSHVIKNSLRFRKSATASLSRTVSTLSTSSFSFWVKRGQLGVAQNLFGSVIIFNANDTLTAFNLTTTAVYRDPSAWYHIQISNNGLFVNGVSMGAVTVTAQTNPSIGSTFDGYIADFICVDSAQPATAFGEFDSFNNIWQPKGYGGAFGASGFWLKFDDAAQIGKDSSGNNNHWTANNIDVAAPGTQATYDLMKDSPVMFDDVGNYCTLNPLKAGTSTLSNGNLTAAGATVEPTIQPTSDTWYFEVDGAAKTWTPPAAFPAGGTNYNFGQRPFTNTPTGKILCTTNLPTPSITKGSDHFDIALGAGAGILAQAQALKAHDLIWIKDRANSNNHQLIDVVRGGIKALRSNTSDGDGNNYSAPGGNSVAWTWAKSKCAGFDIVQYTGNGSSQNIPHNLGAVPDFIIVKRCDAGSNWLCWHSSMGVNDFIKLNSGDGKASNAAIYSSAPTSTEFHVGGDNDINSNSARFIAYLWTAIPGMSAFGSYTGNGNAADGVFVYTGFQPKCIIYKRSDTGGAWRILDTARGSHNQNNLQLLPSQTDAEGNNAGWCGMDILSNGFKMRNSDAHANASGGHYIFAAFAEHPFKIALAR